MKKRRKQTQRKLKRSIIVFLSALLALFIIGFIGLKITENGTYTVYDIKTQEQYGTYNHFIFAKWKMHSLEENENIVISTNQGEPLVGSNTPAGKAYQNICDRVMGKDVPFMEITGPTFFQRLANVFKK